MLVADVDPSTSKRCARVVRPRTAPTANEECAHLVLESMDVMVARLALEVKWPTRYTGLAWVKAAGWRGTLTDSSCPGHSCQHRMKRRRHTGLQRDQTEHNRERFIPPLFTGLR